jgi:hypothetical protein
MMPLYNDNNNMIRLNYQEVKRYLKDNTDFNEAEILRTIKELRNMEPNIRKMFAKWFNSRNSDDCRFPEDEINGVTIFNIMQTSNLMSPTAAFLTLNWIQTDPHRAKTLLMRPHDTIKEIPDLELYSDETIAEEVENTEDIEI